MDTPAWLRSSAHGWLPAALSPDGRVRLVACSEIDEAAALEDAEARDGAQTVPRATPDGDLGKSVSDMTGLAEVSEAAMLHNLRVSYLDQGAVYTQVGAILVSVNPYRPMPALYDADAQRLHSGRGAPASGGGAPALASPHLFDLAESAHRELRATGRGQALVMSGESGAGKTEACKLAMAYLASAAGGAADAGAIPSGVARRVSRCLIESNGLLESLGNAKTFRNDNSSRFGKWVSLHFTYGGAVVQ